MQLFQTDYIDVFQIHDLLDWQTHLNAVAGSVAPLPQELRDSVRRETERCL